MIWEIAASVIIVAMIFVLVRPGSKGPEAIKQISDAFSSLIRQVIG